MKILTVVGARPQFIKAAPLSQALRQQHNEVLVHTGQHYDTELSASFFCELAIPAPDYQLGVGSGPHGAQTAAMLTKLEEVIVIERPDLVLVYGDTNSTLAGTLAASKLRVPLAHVEAGVRSGNWRMPEECNRVLTDAAADLLLAPTQTAVDHLQRESVHGQICWVGDVMLDVLLAYSQQIVESTVWERWGLVPGSYYVATVHRAENTDDPLRLQAILQAFRALKLPLIWPLHPRTRKQITASGLISYQTPGWIAPVGYLDMLALVKGARCLLTDSGGLQKEAAFLGTPCVTLREETEWPETIELGWNRLSGVVTDQIVAAVSHANQNGRQLHQLFGGGQAAQRIVEAITSLQSKK
ncbi:MAG: UDP-N-acetylglucosamine 2-epimerase (non-hydrolyzing) [Cyanobacteria bacterium NC_groundwater_1444_Ag_S-0.65um_54_12]|nr:UDP-N-acetylglucosamine 2-epimerase (non-hydrolyzing) [Cyanobacteria bacterium NC_groundwater_1444_Ag_S-0.65um_54_12]